MYESEARHKVVTKNLEDIIKESTFTTKRNTIDDLLKCERHLKTEPREKNSINQSERFNTVTISQENELKQSQLKNNLSMSKHSIQSKEKINLQTISTHQVKLNDSRNTQNKNKICNLHSNSNFYSSTNSNSKQKSNQNKNSSSNNHETQSLYFNQVDAIFTELEDFLRETREKVLFCVNENEETKNSNFNEMTDEMDELFIVFKEEVERLVERYTENEIESQVLKHHNKMQKTDKAIKQNENNKLSDKNNISRGYNSDSKSKNEITKAKSQNHPFNEDEFRKFEAFIQRQNTINSTIMSDNQDDNDISQLPTETDAELLSILVLKNKLSNTKRKYQNTSNTTMQNSTNYSAKKSSNISAQNSILLTKSGRGAKECSEGEYSFRNNNFNDNMSRSQSKNISSTDKKTNSKKLTSPIQNKENREKSVYEIVLEENKRLKTKIYK